MESMGEIRDKFEAFMEEAREGCVVEMERLELLPESMVKEVNMLILRKGLKEIDRMEERFRSDALYPFTMYVRAG